MGWPCAPRSTRLQGAVDPRHVDSYLDEFTFRFNRRSSRSREMLFYRLVQQSVDLQQSHQCVALALDLPGLKVEASREF
jgi:hypothetical protein